MGDVFPRSVSAWLRAPAALVVWDLQPRVAARAVNLERVLEATSELLALAKAARAMIVYSRHMGVEWDREDAAWCYQQWQAAGRPSHLPEPRCRQEDPSSDIYDAIRPSADEAVIVKRRPALFAGTSAFDMFTRNGIQALVLAGVATDRRVLGTAREAVHRGFYPLVVAEATTSFTAQAHTDGLREAGRYGSVVSLDDIRANWGQGHRVGAPT